jgi:hypothetical protein
VGRFLTTAKRIFTPPVFTGRFVSKGLVEMPTRPPPVDRLVSSFIPIADSKLLKALRLPRAQLLEDRVHSVKSRVGFLDWRVI